MPRFFAFLPAALVLLIASAAAEETPDAIVQAFLAEHGQALDACFAGLPPLRDIDPAGFDRPEPDMPPLRRLVIALDGSGSMAGSVGGTRKIDAAHSAARAFLATVPEDVEVGLIAFGHRGNNQESGRAESCAGVEVVSPIAGGNRANVTAAIDQVSATGWTPLAAAIEAAGVALPVADGVGEQVVYIVSDGKETCGGDPVAAARALQEGPVRAVVNIIGFDLAEEDRAQLAAVAAAGGGVFEEVTAQTIEDGLERASRAVTDTFTVANKAVEGVGAIVGNTFDTNASTINLGTCVSSAIVNEQSAFNRVASGVEDFDLRRAALLLLRERHAEARERRNAYVRAASDANAARREEIQSDVQTTREGAAENR